MSHNLSKLHFGDYEVLDTPEGEPWILGEGAFATTYLAEHRFLKAVRALKVIRPEALAREGMRERVRSEAIEQSKLKHPGIAAVFDAFDSGERLCIVLEYCNGGSLARLAAERGPLPVPVAFMIGAQAASAMDYAHRRGLIHRDIKPENILLHRDEEDSTVQAKLIDFGLAMRAENESSIASVRASGFVGSPLYASPEQLRSSSLGPGSDLFSIGITLWYLLIGRVPFDGDAFAIALDRGSEQSYEPRLPGSLRGTPRAIIAGLIQKNAQDRCATSGDLYQMLVAWLQSESPHGVELESGWGFAAPVLQSPPRSSRKDSTGESLLPSRDRRTVGDFLIPWEAQAVGSSTLGSVMQGRDPGSGREVEITRLLPHFEPAVGDRIQGLVQRMVLAGMPGLLPALSFRSLGDGQLLITDCPGHLRLMDLVRAAPAGGWPFADALPLLAKIAEAMDDASELGLPSLLVEPSDIELVPAGVRAEQAFKTMLRPSADRQSLRETPLSEWQVLFQPVFLLETETSTRSSTGLSNASPEQTLLEQKSRFSYSMAFASLLCWVLCGRPPSRHLAGIPGLSGEASRIISQILQRERHAADCGSIFGELCRAEGLTAANPHEEEVQRLIQTGDSNLAAITQRLPDLEQQIQALEQKRSLLPEVARKQLDAPAEEIGRSFSQVSEKLQELNRQRAALPRSADHLGEAGSAKGLLVVKELRRFEEDCRRLQADLRKIEQNLVDAEEESARLDAEALEQETRERHQSRLLDQLKQAAGGVPALQDRCAAYWTRYATLSEETRHILSQVETTATGLKSPDPWHLKIKTLSVRWEASIGRWNSFQAEMESIATILNADFSPLQPLTEIEAAAASVQAAGIRLREIESSGAALASEAAVLQGQANTLLKEVTDQAAREELEALSVTGRLAKSALSRAEAAIQVAGEAGHRLVALSQLLQNALGQDVDLRPEAEALLGQIPTLPSWHEVLPDCQAAALAAQSRDSTNHESAAAETERLATAICDRSEAFVAETQRIEAATAQFQQALDSAGLARNAAALRLQITGLLQKFPEITPPGPFSSASAATFYLERLKDDATDLQEAVQQGEAASRQLTADLRAYESNHRSGRETGRVTDEIKSVLAEAHQALATLSGRANFLQRGEIAIARHLVDWEAAAGLPKEIAVRSQTIAQLVQLTEQLQAAKAGMEQACPLAYDAMVPEMPAFPSGITNQLESQGAGAERELVSLETKLNTLESNLATAFAPGLPALQSIADARAQLPKLRDAAGQAKTALAATQIAHNFLIQRWTFLRDFASAVQRIKETKESVTYCRAAGSEAEIALAGAEAEEKTGTQRKKRLTLAAASHANTRAQLETAGHLATAAAYEWERVTHLHAELPPTKQPLKMASGTILGPRTPLPPDSLQTLQEAERELAAARSLVEGHESRLKLIRQTRPARWPMVAALVMIGGIGIVGNAYRDKLGKKKSGDGEQKARVTGPPVTQKTVQKINQLTFKLPGWERFPVYDRLETPFDINPVEIIKDSAIVSCPDGGFSGSDLQLRNIRVTVSASRRPDQFASIDLKARRTDQNGGFEVQMPGTLQGLDLRQPIALHGFIKDELVENLKGRSPGSNKLFRVPWLYFQIRASINNLEGVAGDLRYPAISDIAGHVGTSSHRALSCIHYHLKSEYKSAPELSLNPVVLDEIKKLERQYKSTSGVFKFYEDLPNHAESWYALDVGENQRLGCLAPMKEKRENVVLEKNGFTINQALSIMEDFESLGAAKESKPKYYGLSLEWEEYRPQGKYKASEARAKLVNYVNFVKELQLKELKDISLQTTEFPVSGFKLSKADRREVIEGGSATNFSLSKDETPILILHLEERTGPENYLPAWDLKMQSGSLTNQQNAVSLKLIWSEGRWKPAPAEADCPVLSAAPLDLSEIEKTLTSQN